MLFSLANIKRRGVRDPEGELGVVPKLLHGRAALTLVEQAITTFEGYVGKPRSEYSPRALEAVMADYRLARCIEACLLTCYSFVQPQLGSVLSTEQLEALEARGLASPSDLRLALWDAANERFGGFVSPARRRIFLAELAEEWGIGADVELVDTLLTLDSDSSAVLSPTRERPTPRELMRLYNRGVVQTLLAHSTGVEIDVSALPGTALKRLYFVAKRRGVLVEIEERRERGGYALALYGPEQAFGTAEKYGRRLAEVTLSLLRSLLTMNHVDEMSVRATARLLLHDRPYNFHIGTEILGRLGLGPETAASAQKGHIAEARAAYSVGSAVEVSEEGTEEPSFDSLVEAKLYKEHKSLEKQGYTHGWRLLREPDPILAPGVVLIPDFAFERAGTRVYMEIAGFWSPTYRERKLAKLRSLAAQEGEGVALLLAVPTDAQTIFSGLPYPVIPYKTGVRTTDLLAVLDARYGQRGEREEAAQSQLEDLRTAARERGLVPENEVADALQAYTRSELLNSARLLDDEECRYVPGVGLLSEVALTSLHDTLQGALESAPGGRLALEEANLLVSSLTSGPADVEALLRLWPEWQVERPSLFEAYLTVAG